MRRLAAFCLMVAAPLAAQQKEQPVGLVMMPGDAQVVRAGSELPLKAKAGEVLFAGDALRSGASPATFLYCPEKASQTIEPKTDALLEAKGLKIRSGKLGAKTAVQSCFLPQTVRVAVASQQHYGVTMVRALTPAKAEAGTLDSRLQAMAAPDRDRVLAELDPVRKALASNPDDQASQLALAGILEKHKLNKDAVAAYRSIAGKWPEAVWVRGKIFELEESIAVADAAASAKPGGGKTYALLVGISRYQKLPQDQWLQYADKDATLFANHLKSPRGGGIPEDSVTLLVDDKATTAAIRNAFNTFLKGRAGKNDTVLMFFAGHGTVEAAGNRAAYIVTHDSDPQDLAATALPMADLQNLLQNGLSKVGRVLAFVDVCRAGTIGTIKSTTVNAAVERLAEAEGEIFGLMASRPKELSMEGPDFGGGHGAFSYYLVKGLAGAADKNGDGIVNVNEIIEFVRDQVALGTKDKQHPRDFGAIENTVALADKSKPGIEVTRWRMLYDSGGRPVQLASMAQSVPAPQVERFRAEVSADPLAAAAKLADLKRNLAPDQYLAAENALRIALEERGQQVILKYLTGDQAPQSRSDFERGAAHFQAARGLTPESIFLEAREVFCRGRSQLFAKDYRGAADLLEEAARLDPSGAYSYNALGIAYLEQADYARGTLAFRDAIRRAPYWAYPRHNLALAYAEQGNYGEAVKAYQQGMKLAPQYSYLPYNLGLVYQRMNRRKEAETAYRRAITLAPDAPDAYNALGSLKAASGRAAEAERLYRQALEKQPDFAAGRHNLALLLAAKPAGRAEAARLWRANIAQAPDYLPSRLALAESLAGAGQAAEAAGEYRAVIERKPDYVAARLALAEIVAGGGDTAGAIAELEEAARRQPASPAVHERIGDLEQARGRTAEAAAAWRAALGQTSDAAARKRLARKLAGK
jgi:tetratricopeptide (TPR) repeat protein